MNDQRESIRQLLRALLAGLVLATAAGCGSADTSTENADPLGAPSDVSAHEPEDIGIGETDSFGQTLCGETDLGVDSEGMRLVNLERYSFERINRRLAEFPEIAEFVGFDQVSDCEGARAAVQGYNDYVDAHPDFIGGPTKEEMLREILSDPANVGAPAGDEEIEKISSGTESNKSGVVQLIRYITSDRGYACTAVRIAGPLFLTAAHCLKEPTADKPQESKYLIKRRRTSGASGWFAGGKWLVANAVAHPKFVGGNDRDYDVALVYFSPDHHVLLGSDPEFNTVRLIATRTPSVGQLQELYGWGRSNDNETITQFSQRWPGHMVPIGVSTTHHFSIMSDGPTLSVCLGDSGGPAIRDGMVTGILADVSPPLIEGSVRVCALPGDLQYWGRLDYKFTWLHEAMFTLQIGQRRAYHCKFHSGNPSDPHDWEHIVSYMNCNERLP